MHQYSSYSLCVKYLVSSLFQTVLFRNHLHNTKSHFLLSQQVFVEGRVGQRIKGSAWQARVIIVITNTTYNSSLPTVMINALWPQGKLPLIMWAVP